VDTVRTYFRIRMDQHNFAAQDQDPIGNADTDADPGAWK
jgi:hypothetical protein